MPNKFHVLIDILLITPPFTQLNTPYPATAYLKSFLNLKNISSYQVDLGIEVIVKLFSQQGLNQIFKQAEFNQDNNQNNSRQIFSQKEKYITVIDEVKAFLQGKNNNYKSFLNDSYLPRASRFNNIKNIKWALKDLNKQDKAKYLCTLFLEDLCDFIIDCVDSDFGFSRYAESIGRSANTFDEIYEKVQGATSFIDELTIQTLKHFIEKKNPKFIGFSVPFPGNLYSTFKCAKFIKEEFPEIKLIMGGGYPTTELRSLSDIRVFEFFDYITLDDGELPIEQIIKNSKNNSSELKRTFILQNNLVNYINNSDLDDYKQRDLAAPDYSDLPLNKYISVIEQLNPMHNLWTNERWNKLTLAHGCYWAKCAFCDCSLDYIKRYDPNEASIIVDRMEELIKQTGSNGFHFVDEAAPPNLMRDVALEIIKRKLKLRWWTNIRFEKSFTPGLCTLLKTSGCIAVSGGLEVASNRLLKLINKGVTVEQVTKVTNNFTKAGLMVHAYLIYGFPTQSKQELIDSLEMVRQMFELKLIDSGFWHQFALTAHSKVNKDFKNYNILPKYKEIIFANNDVEYDNLSEINYSKYSFGLKKSLYNYMHSMGLNEPLSFWFNFKVPKTSIKKGFINSIISENSFHFHKPNDKFLWLGVIVDTKVIKKSKKGRSWELLEISFNFNNDFSKISVDKEEGEWLLTLLQSLENGLFTGKSYSEIKESYELAFSDFELFWYSKSLQKLKQQGLIVL